MLEQSHPILHEGRKIPPWMVLSGSEPLPLAFSYWLAELSRDIQRLAVHCKEHPPTVVAELLDHLVIEPGLAEIDTAQEPHWWQRWRLLQG